MLKVFRENLKRLAWVLWLVIAAFVILLFYDPSTGAGSNPQSTAATVGEEEISFREFENQYRNLESQFRNAYGDAYTPDLAKQLGLPQQALNNLVARRILLIEAQRMGLGVSSTELQNAILEVPALLDERGRFVGPERYQQVLRANRIEIDDFEQSMREQVLLQKLDSVLIDTVYVSDAEAEEALSEEAERATVRYLRLRPEEISEEIEVTDDQLAAYFEEHKADYQIPEQRRVGYFSVNTNVIRASLEISAEDLRAYYDSNQAEFTREEQVKARHILLFVNDGRSADETKRQLNDIRARIEAGEDFGAIAQEISDDDASKDRGGDLGFFARGRMTQAFEEAAFGGEVGALIGPVENQLGPRTGYHLILVEGRQEGGLQSFEEVENRIRVRLLNDRSREQAEARATTLHTQIAATAAGSEDELRALAETEGVSFEVPEPFAPEDNIPGIGRGTPFARTAFELEPGAIGEPVRIATGWALPTVLEILPARFPDLEDVREQTQEALIADRRSELALERLQQQHARLGATDHTLEKAAEELAVEIVDGGSVGRRDSVAGLGYLPEVNRAALALEVGEFSQPLKTDLGVVLLEVVEREHYDPEAGGESKQQKLEELRIARTNALRQALIERRRTELGVTLSRDLITNFELPEGTES